jgi:hypothetical protein
VGSNHVGASPRRAALHAAVIKFRTLRYCCLRGATTVIIASTKRGLSGFACWSCLCANTWTNMSISNIPPLATTPMPMPSAIAAVLALRSLSYTSSFVSTSSCLSTPLTSFTIPPSSAATLGSDVCCDSLSVGYSFVIRAST